MGYCLPDSSFLLSYNPETASRVTLALLGIVFQTKLFTTDTHLCFSHFYQLLIHIIYTDAHFLLLVITIERANKIWLEANTERSESNPGRSLGVLTTTQKSLSGRQYLVDELTRLWLARHVQNLSRITRMRRICSFTDFYCVVGFLCACRALGFSRINSCWRNPAPYRCKYNPKEIQYQVATQN